MVSTKTIPFLLREERITTSNFRVNPVWYLTHQSSTSTSVEHYIQKRRKQLILIRNITTFLKVHDLNMLPAWPPTDVILSTKKKELMQRN